MTSEWMRSFTGKVVWLNLFLTPRHDGKPEHTVEDVTIEKTAEYSHIPPFSSIPSIELNTMKN